MFVSRSMTSDDGVFILFLITYVLLLLFVELPFHVVFSNLTLPKAVPPIAFLTFSLLSLLWHLKVPNNDFFMLSLLVNY